MHDVALGRAPAALRAAAALAGTGRADTYDLDSAHTTIGFAVKHLVVSTVHGSFADVAGTFSYDPAKPGTQVAQCYYSYENGTSMASPHVAGAAALTVRGLGCAAVAAAVRRAAGRTGRGRRRGRASSSRGRRAARRARSCWPCRISTASLSPSPAAT